MKCIITNIGYELLLFVWLCFSLINLFILSCLFFMYVHYFLLLHAALLKIGSKRKIMWL